MKKNINTNALKISSFVIILFPIFLITGPFFPDLICTFAAIYFLFFIFKNNQFKLLDNYFFYFFLAIYIYLNLNSLNSFDASISFKTSLAYIRVIIFIFFISLVIKENFNILKYIYFSIFLAFTFLFIDTLFRFFFHINIFGSAVVVDSRMSSFFGEEKIMGSYISRILPLMIGISYLLNIKNSLLLNAIILFISSILIILSGERVASLYLAIFVFFYFFLNSKYFLTFFVSIIIVFSLIISVNPVSIKRIVFHTVNQKQETNYFLSYRHILHLKTAYDMFVDKKFLGHGLKSFRHLCHSEKYKLNVTKKIKKDIDNFKLENKHLIIPKYFNLIIPQYLEEYDTGCNTHPHNIYFEFLAEIGLIGFIFFFILFIYITIQLIINFYKLIIKKDYNKFIYAKFFILLGIFITMIPMVPSGSYFNNWLLLISYFPMGFYLSILNRTND